jgi:hypothetical protein
MWRVLAVLFAFTASACAGKAEVVWHEAEVVSVDVSTAESQELSLSRSDGSFPSNSIVERRTTTYIYVFKTNADVYRAKLVGKPLPGVKEGSHVSVSMKGGSTLQIVYSKRKRPRSAELLPQN